MLDPADLPEPPASEEITYLLRRLEGQPPRDWHAEIEAAVVEQEELIERG